MEIKKIGILTSGGDAPAMNAAIKAFVSSCKYHGITPIGIKEGYKGLILKELYEFDDNTLATISSSAGTILYSARFPEMKEEETRIMAAKAAKELGIDALVCIGGDGTYMGAYKLSLLGVPCVGIPGTIDNDIVSTDYTIGFDSALNNIVDACDALLETGISHHRAMILEVMGRHNPDLAIRAGIATGATYVIKDVESYNEDELLASVKKANDDGKRTALILVCEHTIDVKYLEDLLNKQGCFEARANVLGHIQRGCKPSAFDRVLAARLADYAVTLLKNGKTGICVGNKGETLYYTDIMEANKLPKKHPEELYKQYTHLTK